MPVVVDSDTASEDPAVVYANRVTKTDSAYREGYFEYEGLRLHYVEAGEGDLVIFYHGFPSYWLSFLDQMEAEYYRDPPGFADAGERKAG